MSCVALILISHIFITAFAWWIIFLAVLGVLLILGILIGIIIHRLKKAQERREQREARFQTLPSQNEAQKVPLRRIQIAHYERFCRPILAI